MKIMIIAAGGDIGGAKTHILTLSKQLIDSNNLKLLSFSRGLLTEEGEALGLDIEVVDNGLNLIKDIKDTLKAVDDFKPDIIHCHGARANMFGILMKKMRKIPVMTTVHSDPKLDYMGMPWKQATYGFVNGLALKRMDYYIAVASHMKELLIDRGYDPERIFTIYNGHDFTGSKETGKTRKGENEKIIIGIAARLTSIKDIDTTLKAFSIASEKNENLLLKIAGTGDVEKHLKELTVKLGIENKVEFLGWISDMKGFFREVDINILSSLSEIMPYSLLEGAYQHCPAISTNVGGIPALIKHGENGLLFEPKDVETLAEYIYELSIDEELRIKMGNRLYEKAKKDFSMEKMRESHEVVYSLIERKKTQDKRQGVLICGAYGRGNAGDEAILKAILSQIKQINPDVPFMVMSRNPKETRKTHEVKAMYIFNIFAFLYQLRKADIFVSGGGSLIQDVTSNRSLYFYLFTLKAAKMMGCKVIMYGCGIGPIVSERNKKLSAKVLNQTADIITLRDTKSAEFLNELSVDQPVIRLAADPTVHLKRAPLADIDAAFKEENIPKNVEKICFCLRNVQKPYDSGIIAKAADYAYEKYNLMPCFLPIEIPNDISAAEAVTKEMKSPYYIGTKKHNVEELIGMLGNMRMVVGMRLHSLIFATAGGAPVIGLSYDIKVDSFIEDIGSEFCMDINNLDEAGLKKMIDITYLGGGSYSVETAERLKKAELTNRRELARLMTSPEENNVVCISTSNFDAVPTRKQNVMRRLSCDRVLYFDPPVTLLAPFKDKSAWHRLFAFRKEKKENNIIIYAMPAVFPFFNRYRIINRINQWILSLFVKRKIKKNKFRDPLLWCYSPTSCDLVNRIPNRGIVYDCVDRHSAYPGMINPKVVDKMEENLSRKADQIFCTAEGLYDTLINYNDNVELIPNGANYELFSKASSSFPLREERIDFPIFGFVGMLQDCLDYDLIIKLAEEFPNAQVRLIGKPLPGVDLSDLYKYPNIFFLGLKKQDELPEFIKEFDVCLNLFKKGKLSKDVSPLKFYEYLATGKPIVSTEEPLQVREFSDVVYIANDSEDFIRKCRYAVSEEDRELYDKRREYARLSSWDNRIRQMEIILKGKNM